MAEIDPTIPWFDTRTGDLLLGAVAVGQRLDEGGPDIVPLPDLLRMDPFPYRRGDFRVAPPRARDDAELAALGNWAFRLIQSPEPGAPPQPLKRGHIYRLQILLGTPHPDTFTAAVGGMAAFNAAKGVHYRDEKARYNHWTFVDFGAYAAGLATKLGRKPEMADYELADGPSPRTLRSLHGDTGVIRWLNDRIGFPNVGAWNRNNYIDWGVRALEANPGQELSPPLLAVLSGRKRGPSLGSIRKNFGSLDEFHSAVAEMAAARAQEHLRKREERLAVYDRLCEDGALPDERLSLTDDEQLAVVARFQFVAACMPTRPRWLHAQLALTNGDYWSLRKAIQVSSLPRITFGQIDEISLQSGFLDELLPQEEEWRRYLRVSPEELQARRAQRNAQDRERYRRRKS